MSTVLTTAEVATALGWPTRKARRWLMRAHAVERVGSRYVTTRETLVTVFPAAYEAVGAVADDVAPSSCPHCDALRAALLERDRQIDLLARRLGERARTRSHRGSASGDCT